VPCWIIFIQELLHYFEFAFLLPATTAFAHPSFLHTKMASSSPPPTTLQAASDSTPLSLGFVGCGTIASAIATGFATQTNVPLKAISISRRSEKKSSELQKKFPDIVTVYDDNQNLVDKSDIIFVCVLPQQTSEVLQGLNFDNERHTLVSLVSTSKLDDLSRHSGLAPARVFKMICLPAVANHQGVCLLTPKVDHPVLLPLFKTLGGCVQATDEAQMSAMMVPSGLMGSMYGILRNNRDWLIQQGVPESDASYLVGRYYWGMVQDAERGCVEPSHFDELIAEQTPGGLNQQGLANIESLGLMDSYDKVQNAILSRIQGNSDGSL
jgi:pyrroline-5-carboxylate reductase